MLKEWACAHSLTAYQIGQKVGQITGEPSSTITQRWQRWLSQDGLKTVNKIKQDLEAMGYVLTIEKAPEIKQFTFQRRTNSMPDGISRRNTFEAEDIHEALQMASDYWFGGEDVSDYIVCPSTSVITLRSNNPGGNVIGTVMEC